MAERSCSIDGCDGKHLARGWCGKHYLRWYKTGTTEIQPKADPFPENLLSRREVQPNGCILFTGCTNDRGYGQVQKDGKRVYVHRAIYELRVGPIPRGMVVDHECHNLDPTCDLGDDCPHRRCTNEDHLILATRGQNTRRGFATREDKPRLVTIPRLHGSVR